MRIPLCSLELVIFICFSHVSLLSIKIPKYLAYSFASSFPFPSRISRSAFWMLFILKNSKLDLSTLRVNLFDINQSEIFFSAPLTSFSRVCKFLLEWKIKMSSAKRWNVTLLKRKYEYRWCRYGIIKAKVHFLGVLHR